MLSTFISISSNIDRPENESWKLTILLFHSKLIDYGFVPLSTSKDKNSTEIHRHNDKSLCRIVVPNGWCNDDGKNIGYKKLEHLFVFR